MGEGYCPPTQSIKPPANHAPSHQPLTQLNAKQTVAAVEEDKHIDNIQDLFSSKKTKQTNKKGVLVGEGRGSEKGVGGGSEVCLVKSWDGQTTGPQSSSPSS